MRQSLRILQMPHAELRGFLQEELAANPFLEEKERDQDKIFIDRWIEERAFSVSTQDFGEDEETPKRELFVQEQVSLETHLLSQWNLFCLPESQICLGAAIIGNLDPSGFLLVPLEEIVGDCGAEIPEAEKVLSIVQSLDPPGVACRDLGECLLLQIRRLDRPHCRFTKLAKKIVEEHLRDLEAKKLHLIARKLKTDLLEVKTAVRLIRALNPKPGSTFGPFSSAPIVPDVIFLRQRGGYEILCNKKDLPELKIHPSYKKLLKDPHTSSEVLQYLRDKLSSALALIRALEQRESTLERVAKYLVQEQPDFLAKGAPHLKPLYMQDLARHLGLHKSTISRAVADKYAETPRGVVELRAFFSNAVGQREQFHSSAAIQNKIRSLIEREPRHRPLSDGKIRTLLQLQAMCVSRRTVAKYRHQLRIPSSYARWN